MSGEEEIIQEVIRAEKMLADAHRELDVGLFDRLLHDEYAIIQPGGKVEDKRDTLTSLRTGSRHWEIADSDEFDVRIYENTAVVISRWRGKGQSGESSFDYSARVLAVWVRENGRWWNVAAQSTPLVEPESA